MSSRKRVRITETEEKGGDKRPVYRRKSKVSKYDRYTKLHPRAGKAPTVITDRNTGVFPDQMMIHTKMVSDTTNWEPAGTTNHWTIKLNDLYDPTFAFDNDQPRDYDAMASLYYNYCCYSGSYKVMFTNTTTSLVNIGYYVDAESTAPTTLREAREKGRWAVIQPAASYKSTYISGKWNVYDYCDMKKQYQNASAVFGVSPNLIVYLHIYGSSAANIVVQTSISMYFNALISQRKRVAPDEA